MTELRPTLPASFLRPEAAVGNRPHRVGAESTTPDIVKDEQDWHQHAARYCALGMKVKDVAEACECSVKQIQNLRATPWFQERVNNLIAESHTDIMTLFKRNQGAVAMKLVDLALGAKSESVQHAAINTLLERIHGKAVQKVEQDTTLRSGDPVQRKAELEREIASLLGNASEAQRKDAAAHTPS